MRIGPNFWNEVAAAGGLIGLPFGIVHETGEITNRQALTAAQLAKLEGVIAAHNPATPSSTPIPKEGVRDLIDAMELEGVLTATRARNIRQRLNLA